MPKGRRRVRADRRFGRRCYRPESDREVTRRIAAREQDGDSPSASPSAGHQAASSGAVGAGRGPGSAAVAAFSQHLPGPRLVGVGRVQYDDRAVGRGRRGLGAVRFGNDDAGLLLGCSAPQLVGPSSTSRFCWRRARPRRRRRCHARPAASRGCTRELAMTRPRDTGAPIAQVRMPPPAPCRPVLTRAHAEELAIFPRTVVRPVAK